MGSTNNKNEEYVKARTQKAGVAFIMLRNILRAKRYIINNQTENIQIKCQDRFTLLDMAKYTEDTGNNRDFHQQMPTQNPIPNVDRQGIQLYTLEMDQPSTHRK